MRLIILLGVSILVLTGCRFFTTKETAVVEDRVEEPQLILVTHRPPIDNSRLDSLRAEFLHESVFDADNLDVAPSFSGGAAAMQRFIESNLRYPLLAAEQGMQGTVPVSFIVEQDGSLSTIHIFESNSDPQLRREAQRLIGIMPEWTPGKRNGETVRTRLTIPVEFRLPE